MNVLPGIHINNYTAELGYCYMEKCFRHFSKKFYGPFHAIRDTNLWPGYSPRLKSTIHTCTVHANLGPWVPGPWVPGSTEYSVPPTCAGQKYLCNAIAQRTLDMIHLHIPIPIWQAHKIVDRQTNSVLNSQVLGSP